MLRFLIPLAAALALSGPKVLFAGALPEGPYISTSAEAEIEMEPDAAELRVRGQVSAPTNEEARTSLLELQNELIGALDEFQKAIAPIVLDQVDSTEITRYDSTVQATVTAGFQHEFGVVVRVQDLDILDRLFHRLVSIDGLTVRTPEFYIHDGESAQRRARDQALANARDEAESLARSQGARLGNVWGIVYKARHGDADPMNWTNFLGDFDEAADLDRVVVTGSRYIAPIRIDPKRVVYSAEVGVVYELRPGTGESQR